MAKTSSRYLLQLTKQVTLLKVIPQSSDSNVFDLFLCLTYTQLLLKEIPGSEGLNLKSLCTLCFWLPCLHCIKIFFFLYGKSSFILPCLSAFIPDFLKGVLLNWSLRRASMYPQIYPIQYLLLIRARVYLTSISKIKTLLDCIEQHVYLFINYIIVYIVYIINHNKILHFNKNMLEIMQLILQS